VRNRKKIAIFSQNDPIFLRKYLPTLLASLNDKHDVEYIFLSKSSPFGKKLSFLAKARKTFDIFGVKFFVFYSIQYLYGRILDLLYPIDKKYKNITYLTENINKHFEKCQIGSVDLAISLSGNDIIKKELLSWPRHGWVNLHCSPLPKYRGLLPSFWALRFDETEFGATVFLMDEGIDSGPIICQERFDISGLTHRDLIKKSKRIGIKLLLEASERQLLGKTDYIENHVDEGSYFQFPTKDDVRDFRKLGKKFF
jgi:methionyl-tRNA formyltransferase